MRLTQIAVIGASLITLTALTACQSTNTPAHTQHHKRMHQDQYGDKFDKESRDPMKKMHGMQREAMKQMRTACDAKAPGTALQIKINDQTLEGTCQMRFTADRQEMKKMLDQSGPRPAYMMRGHNAEPLTDAQRAELTKQFDQRLALRQAKQNAIAQACQGKANGTATEIILGEQTIHGKCEVRFQPKPAAMNIALPIKSA